MGTDFVRGVWLRSSPRFEYARMSVVMVT